MSGSIPSVPPTTRLDVAAPADRAARRASRGPGSAPPGVSSSSRSSAPSGLRYDQRFLEAVDGAAAPVRLGERGERLGQSERRRADQPGRHRVDRRLRAVAPDAPLAVNSTTIIPLRPEPDRHGAVGTLAAGGAVAGADGLEALAVPLHELAVAGAAHDLVALGEEHDVDRQRPLDGDDRLQGVEERDVRPLRPESRPGPPAPSGTAPSAPARRPTDRATSPPG